MTKCNKNAKWHGPCKAFYKSAKHRHATDGKNKMRKNIEISNAPNGQESHLSLAVALSISMIFTSYLA